MKLESLIEQLADGDFHSGSEIGALLGVSRTAVWKSLANLKELGLECESVKGKGYRLRYPIDLLSSEKILSFISAEYSKCLDLSLALSTESTNMLVSGMSIPEDGYAVCLSEHQSGGRGRRGRSWVSPFGRNIYMSVAFELPGGVEALSGLSLVVGIGVANALQGVGVSNVQLKWPNDVWIDDQKVCGILVELQGEATTSWRVVVGVGLNVSMEDEDLGAEDIDQAWTSVGRHQAVERNVLVAKLLESFVSVFTRFREKGFGDFLADWAKLDALEGCVVSVNKGQMSGVAIGVDRQGALLLRDESGEIQVVNAGEVSVRCQ